MNAVPLYYQKLAKDLNKKIEISQKEDKVVINGIKFEGRFLTTEAEEYIRKYKND